LAPGDRILVDGKRTVVFENNAGPPDPPAQMRSKYATRIAVLVMLFWFEPSAFVT